MTDTPATADDGWPLAYPRFSSRRCPDPKGTGCQGRTTLALCRGTTGKAENAGRWYEHCNGDTLEGGTYQDRHFVRFIGEYPRWLQLPQLSVNTLLTQPPTPQTSPRKDVAVNRVQPSTIQEHQAILNVVDPSLHADLLDILSYSAATSGAASANAATDDIAPDPVPSRTQPQPLAAHTQSSNQSLTEGKCQGPLCKGPSGAMKPAKACTFKMCKRCCLHHQHSISKSCKNYMHCLGDPTAYVPPSDAPTNPLTSTPGPSGFYDRSKPLSEAHYQLKLQAQAGPSRINQVAEHAKLQGQLGLQVEIIFWGTDRVEPYHFFTPCQGYPLFSLRGSCPDTLLKTFKLSPALNDAADYIETFIPESNRWASHQLDTVRDVTKSKVLLYRSIGINEGKSMQDEQESLLALVPARTKSRKRPVTEADFVDISPKAQRLKTSHPSYKGKGRALSMSSELEDHDSPSPPVTDYRSSPPPTLASMPRSPSPASLPSPREAFFQKAVERKPAPPALGTSRTRITPSQAPTKIESDLPFGGLELDFVASSEKGPFPFKYAISMSKFFAQMDSLPGTAECRFNAAFPVDATVPKPFPRTSYFEAHKLWTHEDLSDLRTTYVQAGYTGRGLWKTFKKEAMKRIKVKKVRSSATPSTPSEPLKAIKTEPEDGSGVVQVSDFVIQWEGGKEVIVLDD